MDIMLNDLLNIDLNKEEYKDAKISLNVSHGGVNHIDNWLKYSDSDTIQRNSFSFSKGKFKHVGQIIIVLTQIPSISNKTWLFTCAARITKIPEDDWKCDAEVLPQFQKYFGRVLINCVKKKGSQGYMFNLRHFLNSCSIISILEKEYGGKPFPGYENINEKLGDLIDIITSKSRGKDWRDKLSSVNAVYCLNNHKEGKAYIGCSYNQGNCLMQRWDEYFTTLDGGNVSLRKLSQMINEDNSEKVEHYYKENFYFSILETFPSNTSKDYIINREEHWMDVFNSRKKGYNNN